MSELFTNDQNDDSHFPLSVISEWMNVASFASAFFQKKWYHINFQYIDTITESINGTKEIKQNWTGPKNVDICIILGYYD